MSSKRDSQNATIGQVEDFIRQLHALIIQIDNEKAMKIQVLARDVNRMKNLPTGLADSILQYENKRNESMESKFEAAKECLYWIEYARTCGVIKEGLFLDDCRAALMRELGECREENTKLKRELAIVSGEYQKLRSEADQISRRKAKLAGGK